MLEAGVSTAKSVKNNTNQAEYGMFVYGKIYKQGDALKSNLNDLFVVCLQARFSGEWLQPSGRNPAC